MRASRHLVPCCLVAAVLAIAACGTDDPYAPRPGSLTIAVVPDSLAAPWTLSGPDGYQESGAGGATLEDMRVGDYTIAWGEVTGWTAPDTVSSTLYDRGEITFTGIYLRPRVATPDECMLFFGQAYGERDLDFYAHLLADDFLFVTQDATIDDRAAELAIAAAIFGGQMGDNGVVISDIDVDQLVPQSVWTPTPPDDPHFGGFPDSWFRQYQIDIKFVVAGQNLILRVQGPVLFYVMDVSPSETPPSYRLLGVVDATYGHKATEDHSWTGVRSLFD
jgi:hypothetical protein